MALLELNNLFVSHDTCKDLTKKYQPEDNFVDDDITDHTLMIYVLSMYNIIQLEKKYSYFFNTGQRSLLILGFMTNYYIKVVVMNF